MADAESIMQGLARIAVEHPGNDDVISAAIELIERLTPRPMTLLHACLALNRHRYLGLDSWTAVVECMDDDGTASTDCGILLLAYEAIAVAEKLEREKEAANG